MILEVMSLLFFWASCSDDKGSDIDKAKPTIDVTVSPQGGLCYGEEITIQGTVTDERNLGMYTISIYDQLGTLLTEKIQMLLGKTFNVDEKITIPLLAGATNGSLEIRFSLKNSREDQEEKDFTISNVSVPQLDRLYLILENNTVYEMAKNGNTFEVENTFPANARGHFSTSTQTSGLFWGIKDGQIISLGKDLIPVGHDIEASYKISFNPYTFDLDIGKYAIWSPLPSSDCFYILGTISGHWQDGEILTEKEKMKMKGFRSGQQRYYSWIPPDGDNPETGMWGEIASGNFRFKKGGEDNYILWDGKEIVKGTTNNTGQSFYTSAGGHLEIRIYFEGEECTSIRLLGSDKTLEFEPDQVKINGISIQDNIDFAGTNIPLKSGANYIYESRIDLKKGQTISSSIDLKKLKGDNDLFDGIGNTTWTVSSVDGTYIIRVDIFSGAFYACPMTGYPDVIYLNGWSWAKTSSDSPVVWNTEYELALIHVGNNVYETTLYNFGWGGSFSLNAYHPYSGKGSVSIPAELFTSEFLLPSGTGNYKISVNLKDGIQINGTEVDVLNNRKLDISFSAL
ncbi:MAG: hypothetical protein LBF62_01600 [Tannerellaceae bacterium]|jgi:hypothetical protein|nr:hypothetical protein [Tannerellaceae bacterium]